MVAEHEAKALLREAGVPVPRGVLSLEAADGLTPPLVLKAFGPSLIHKSDSGAVALNLTLAEISPAAADMRSRLGDRIAGFLVEEQVPAGVELIVGLVRDPGFGPVLLTGLGGVWTEALRDTALRLCPISVEDARAMLASLRGSSILYGWRGRPAVDVDAVVKLLMTLGGPGGLWERLDLGEFELNPVIASPTGVVAVDARYLPAGAVAVDARYLPAEAPAASTRRSPSDFTPLFEPRAVAVVGASTTRPNFGNMFLEFYKAAGIPLVAVHPEATEIDGVPAVPSLGAADVDYALVAVPAERCAGVLRQAGGVPYIQIMSGGFGEAGRADLEDELLAALPAGTRLLGPNCMGVYSPRGRQTFLGGGIGPAGTVALISQSGGLAGEVVKVGERRGLAFSRVATVGNSLDVTPAELLRWLAADPETAAVGLYVEDPRDGRALFEAVSESPVPVVMLVGGRTGQGQRAAASHTGGMVSDGRVWESMAEQSGAALVTSQDDLIGVLSYYQSHTPHPTNSPTNSPAPRPTSGAESHPPTPGAEGHPPTPGAEGHPPTPGAEGHPPTAGGPSPDSPRYARDRVVSDGLLVVGPSGGASVLAADVFDRANLDLTPLPDEALNDLRALGVGVGSSLANPLEVPVGPRGRAELVKEAITAIVGRKPYGDVVAHVNVQSFFTFGTAAEPLLEYGRQLAQAQDALPGTRISLVVRNGECAPPGVEDQLRSIVAGIPVYRSMEAAATAVAAWRRFWGGTDGAA